MFRTAFWHSLTMGDLGRAGVPLIGRLWHAGRAYGNQGEPTHPTDDLTHLARLDTVALARSVEEPARLLEGTEMITAAEIIDRSRLIKLADVGATLGDDYVRAYNRGYTAYFRGTESDRYMLDDVAFAGWQAAYEGNKWNDDYTQDAMLAHFAAQAVRAEAAPAETIELDDASRTVEVVAGEDIAWEATGRAVDVALWLGNATEHDREAIRTLARQVAGTGRALRISFGSVLPFYMGATSYGGRQLYRIYVPVPAHTA
jgi:hypothetical protein